MGRDTGAGARRLDRVLGLGTPHDGDEGGPLGGLGGPLDGSGPGLRAELVGDEDVEPVGGGHEAAQRRRGSSWRVAGVPAGAAVACVVAAVVAGVVLLGGGTGSEELLLGPAGVAAAVGSVAPGASYEPADGPRDGPEPGTAVGVEGGTTGGEPVVGGTVVGEQVVGGAPGGGAEPVVAPPAGPLVVHVDGAVVHPGVVQVPAGSRVGDAVTAAGGVTQEADTRLVNLARPLSDGELVVVPRPGEPAVSTVAAGGPGPLAAAAGAGAGGAPVPGAGNRPLDLNAADAAELDALPGIGPVLAERIVSHREALGRFSSVDDLDAVSGIGPAVLADLRDLVTV